MHVHAWINTHLAYSHTSTIPASSPNQTHEFWLTFNNFIIPSLFPCFTQLGKQLLHNFEHVHHEIATWDLRQTPPTSLTDNTYASLSSSGSSIARLSQTPEAGDHYQALNALSLQDSRLSVPEPSPQHTIVTVHNSSLVRNSTALGSDCYGPNEVVGIEVTPVPQRKGSEGEAAFLRLFTFFFQSFQVLLLLPVSVCLSVCPSLVK